MAALLIVVLIVVAGVAVWIAIRHAAYKASHPYMKSDLEDARKDTLTKSRSITLGKTQEQVAPLFPEFLSQFNPNDARFLGSPLDFVVFDGLCDGDDVAVRQIVFVEVKTGKANLSRRERRVRDAIQAGRVSYQMLRLPGTVEIADGDGARALEPSDALSA